MTITTLTIGTVSATSYATIAEADEYLTFDPDFGEDWEELEDNEKIRRLVGATRRLDQLNWRGELVDPDQNNAWPRSGLKYPDDRDFPEDSVPKEVEEVTIILAGDMAINLKATVTDHTNVRSFAIGPKTESYFHQNRTNNELLLPDGLLKRVGFWIEFPPAIGAERMGEELESEFDPNKYGRTIEGVY